jgi:adenylate cyclase
MAFPIPVNEPQRLAALRAFDILDTAPEIAYDEIAELAAHVCNCPKQR